MVPKTIIIADSKPKGTDMPDTSADTLVNTATEAASPEAAGSSVVPANPPTGLLESATELMNAGGPVVWILFGFSVVALVLVIAKLLQFRQARFGDQANAHQALAAWRNGRREAALRQAERGRDPVSQAMARAMRGELQDIPEEKVREEVWRYGSDLLYRMRTGLRPLEVIGALAPLLGLLGTVMGMIEAFQQLEAAGNRVNPAILSGGIWEALLTTAVGLSVAIPVVALSNWLERRVDRLAHDMDNIVTQVFTQDLSAHSASPAPASAPAQATGKTQPHDEARSASLQAG